MSGPGGGGPGPGGPSSGPGVDCSTLTFRTTLNSPDPDVVAQLNRGDILGVRAESDAGPIVAVTSEEEVVGSITSSQMAELLRCVDEGYTYVAIVRSISGGRVDVEVRPESK